MSFFRCLYFSPRDAMPLLMLMLPFFFDFSPVLPAPLFASFFFFRYRLICLCRYAISRYHMLRLLGCLPRRYADAVTLPRIVALC